MRSPATRKESGDFAKLSSLLRIQLCTSTPILPGNRDRASLFAAGGRAGFLAVCTNATIHTYRISCFPCCVLDGVWGDGMGPFCCFFLCFLARGPAIFNSLRPRVPTMLYNCARRSRHLRVWRLDLRLEVAAISGSLDSRDPSDFSDSFDYGHDGRAIVDQGSSSTTQSLPNISAALSRAPYTRTFRLDPFFCTRLGIRLDGYFCYYSLVFVCLTLYLAFYYLLPSTLS